MCHLTEALHPHYSLFLSFPSHLRQPSTPRVYSGAIVPRLRGSLTSHCGKQYLSIAKTTQSSFQFFVLKSAEIVSSFALKKRELPVNDLLQILHLAHFFVVFFKSTFKQKINCKDMVECNEEKVVTKNGFQKCASQKTLIIASDVLSTTCKTIQKLYKSRSALRCLKATSCSVHHTIFRTLRLE